MVSLFVLAVVQQASEAEQEQCQAVPDDDEGQQQSHGQTWASRAVLQRHGLSHNDM